MKPSEFRKLIREEVKNILLETGFQRVKYIEHLLYNVRTALHNADWDRLSNIEKKNIVNLIDKLKAEIPQ